MAAEMNSNCQMSVYFGGNCGVFPKFPYEIKNTTIGKCNRDISYHLKRTHLTEADASTEGKLLLLRAGFFHHHSLPGADDLTICPRHRYLEGLYWCPLKSCNHPAHTGKRRVTKGLSAIWSARLYKELKQRIPVGTGICRTCYDLEKMKDLRSTDETVDLVENEPAATLKMMPAQCRSKDCMVEESRKTSTEIQKPTMVKNGPAATMKMMPEQCRSEDCMVEESRKTSMEIQKPTMVPIYPTEKRQIEVTSNDEMASCFQPNILISKEAVAQQQEKRLSLDIVRWSDQTDIPDVPSQEAITEPSEVDSQQLSQLSQLSSWSEEELGVSLAGANSILSKLSRGSVSPLRAQLRSDIKDVGSSTVFYYKRKANESIESLLELLAPGRSSQLKDVLFCKHSKKESTDTVETFITKDIIKLYEETSDNNLKTQLLSLIASKLSKTELQRLIPGLTIYQIDRARLASTSMQGLSIPIKQKQPRQRMNQLKLQHALSFFFDPGFVQTVSYGVRELQLDSGEKLEIPDVVRTVCNSKIIDMYTSFCKETDFEPLGRTSLYRILKECAASKRTNLRGLDNITAAGIEGFDMLEELVSSLIDAGHLSHDLTDGIQAALTSSKLYLKTDYKLHIQQSDLCADHCLHWSLSDPSNKNLQSLCSHTHTLICDRCEQFKHLQEQLDSAINILPNGMKEDAGKTVQDSIEQINQWKAHIIRTINQDQFRLNLLDTLESNEGLLIMDWAMKFLPMKYRQTQSEWFGQRGINWHVTVCIFREETQLRHHTYTHVLDGVKQDWYSVLSILEHTLLNVKVQLPQIKKVYLRSDNAGCYHNGHIWLCLPEVSKRTGIEISEFCYSEPQAGKSYCDAKIAHMRQKIKTYVAAGHNVCTAADMKEALDSGQGVSGCQVAVIDIDTSQQALKTHKLKHVTLQNDIRYEKGDIVMHRAYGIGAGQILPGESLHELSSGQAVNTLSGHYILSDFKLPTKCKGKITAPPKKQESQTTEETDHTTEETGLTTEETGLFSCPDTGCVLQFNNFSALSDHLLVGKHQFALERETTYDSIKRQWASLCSEVRVTQRPAISSEHRKGFINAESCQPMGWALKKNKTAQRFSQPVKDFLINKFEEGLKTGKKANPHDVMREMRGSRTADGERKFPLKDCLNATQINSYFSKLSILKTQRNKCKEEKTSEEEVDNDLMAVLSALEENTLFEQLQQNTPYN